MRNKNDYLLPTDSHNVRILSFTFMEFTVLLICFQITLVEWKNQKGLQEIQFLKACKAYKEGGLSRVLDLHFAAGEPSVVNL